MKPIAAPIVVGMITSTLLVARASLWDRLFWILFSRWAPQWRDSLIIVQPETVLRWRREGRSALWRYRAHGRWRGGRPRISSEVRDLIAQMAREID